MGDHYHPRYPLGNPLTHKAMRHYDLSVNKVLPMAFLTVLLVALVNSTFRIQRSNYGHTPFFKSVEYAAQEELDFVRYSLDPKNPNKGVASLFAAVFGMGAKEGTTTAETSGVPVLAYHRVVDAPDGSNITTETFRDQMYALKAAGWNTITLKEFNGFIKGEKDVPEKSILITFDDGAKESLYPVDPIFRTLGMNGVAYIILNGMDTEGSTYYLSKEEIQNMLESGRWEIGSHSRNGHTPHTINETGDSGHFFSDKLWLANEKRMETEAEFRARVAQDLAESRSTLEETFKVPVTTFAFPFGDSGEETQNFPNSTRIVIEEAQKVYDIGFLQARRDEYTFNHPGRGFIAYRIEPGAEWSGEDLLAVLSSGSPKGLSYTAHFSPEEGWIPSWGSMSLSGKELSLGSIPEASSASAILNGAYDWDNYTAEATASWTDGNALILGDVTNSRLYRACSYSDGMVRLQAQTADGPVVLAKASNESIQDGASRKIGIKTSGTTISCLWNGAVVVSATAPNQKGGVGIQVWNPKLGKAQVTVSSLVITKN